MQHGFFFFLHSCYAGLILSMIARLMVSYTHAPFYEGILFCMKHRERRRQEVALSCVRQEATLIDVIPSYQRQTVILKTDGMYNCHAVFLS